MLNNISVPDTPLPSHRVSVMERYDKERTAAFGALTDAIEAVADKITDGQYKAIYDAAMVIYQRSTPPEGVRAMVLDAESLNQVASAAATAAVAASDRRERDAAVVGRPGPWSLDFDGDTAVARALPFDRRGRVLEYEREAVNAMQAAHSPDPIEAEWGAMWMSEVDEGYGGPWIPRPDGSHARTGPRMFPRGVQQVMYHGRPPTARHMLAYHRMAALAVGADDAASWTEALERTVLD